MIPIPKSVNAKTPNDTRPINLINNRTKLVHKMVNNRLIYVFEKNHFIDDNQFGFRKNKQTLNSLIMLNNKILSSLQNGLHTQIVSFDIKKAFDTVWPESIFYQQEDL